MTDLIETLHGEEALGLTDFAQLVALRWDVVPWAVVLDLNCASECLAGQRRGWLVFVGISSVTWKLHNARLPNGVVLTSPISLSHRNEDLSAYDVPCLTPTFDDDDSMEVSAHNVLAIESQGFHAFVSRRSQIVDTGWLSYEQRNSLAEDADFLRVIDCECSINQPGG